MFETTAFATRPVLRLVPDLDHSGGRAGMVDCGQRTLRRKGAVVATSTLESALPNLVVESLLPAASTLVLGDAGMAEDHRLTLESPDPARRPFVWVTGPVDGPVRSVCVIFRTDRLDRRPSLIGYLDCPSGRLVAGAPDAVVAWGLDIEPETGLPAQARAYDHDRRLRGLVVVADALPGRYPVYALEGDGGFDAVMVDVTAAGSLSLAG